MVLRMVLYLYNNTTFYQNTKFHNHSLADNQILRLSKFQKKKSFADNKLNVTSNSRFSGIG